MSALLPPPYVPTGSWWHRVLRAIEMAVTNWRLRRAERAPDDRDLLETIEERWS